MRFYLPGCHALWRGRVTICILGNTTCEVLGPHRMNKWLNESEEVFSIFLSASWVTPVVEDTCKK